LTYPKFSLNESEIDFILTHEILPFFETFKVKPGKRYVKADAADDKFIGCAIACRADAIVSGDSHLLNLAESPVPIFNAVDFLKEL
jgi:predicted nucleic acid-binding protein